MVLLDEPFSGLDPVNAVTLREAILDLRRNGATIIFSTHDMSVAEQLCDFMFMIYKGRKVLDGTLESIQDAYGNDTRAPVHIDGVARLEDLPGVTKVTDLGRFQELRLMPKANPQELFAHLIQRGRVAISRWVGPRCKTSSFASPGPRREADSEKTGHA